MIKLLLSILWVVFNFSASVKGNSSLEESRFILARQILREAPLVDGHNDLPFNMKIIADNKLETFRLDRSLENLEPWASDPHSHTDIPRMKKGQVGAQFWAAYNDCKSQELNSIQLALEQIDVIKRMAEKYSEHFQFVTSSDGIVEAFKNGKIGSLIGLEGGHMIRSSLATLRMLYELGTRYMTLTHTCNTPWASASPVESKDSNMEDNGLTQFGKTVVLEMNRLGMMVDLSHVSSKTMKDAMDTSLAPVIFSHSGVRSICDHHRNVPDDVLHKLRENGGVLMVTFYDKHINCDGNSTLFDVINHINHIRKTAGIDHVGIGADYDGVSRLPKGLEDVTKYPDLLAELLKDPQWGTGEIKKLTGGNILRVFRQVEKKRDELASEQKPSEELVPEADQRGFSNCTFNWKDVRNKGPKAKNGDIRLQPGFSLAILIIFISVLSS